VLPDIAVTNLENQTSNLQDLRGQWLLVTVGGGACNLDCENLLYVQRQLHKSLGKEQAKLDRVWLVNDAAPVDEKLIQALNGATVLRSNADSLGQWLSPASNRALSDHLYLIDPMGRWMMRFPPHPDASSAAKIKRDVERLIRAASSWDQPGR
ncbi:MAG: cytochrome oxidase assembly protein Sco1/SenC family, partial [Pseudomonadota bacterium]